MNDPLGESRDGFLTLFSLASLHRPVADVFLALFRLLGRGQLLSDGFIIKTAPPGWADYICRDGF
jgi:hypothetical protein